MATEIFRFMTIRPPQEVDSATAIKNGDYILDKPNIISKQANKQCATLL